MSSIVDFPKRHIQAECKKDNCGGTCIICCCGVCDVCGCFEGSLTTHCFGKRVSQETQDEIYEKGLDYINGEWTYLDDKHVMAKNPRFA